MKLQPIEIKDERIVDQILKFEENSESLGYPLDDYYDDGLQMLDAAKPIEIESMTLEERELEEFNDYCRGIVICVGDLWDDDLLITTRGVNAGVWFFSKFFVMKLTRDYVVKIHFNAKCPPPIAALVVRELNLLEARNILVAKSYNIDEGGDVKNFE